MAHLGAGLTDNSDKDHTTMLGISLTSESLSNDPQHDITIGVVSVKPSTTVDQLRSEMSLDIPSLPVNFVFVTKQGWPVTRSQESSIQVQQLLTPSGTVRIQRCYDKPRVGIQMTDGRTCGFVFVDLTCSADLLRQVIYDQLGGMYGQRDFQFHFVDRNGWPLSSRQEKCLCVLDLLHNACVRICPSIYTCPPLAIESSESSCDCGTTSHRSSFTKLKNKLTPPQLTFRTVKDQSRTSSHDGIGEPGDPKQILLSYVRAEASANALLLKSELASRGFSVYLDVHEIKSGIDWQDSLNYAVSNCEVFIPLVTPRYGETQWTNREVKLADVLNKQIIPVSFLHEWPPKCLAIQFATTQYIPWKVPPVQQDSGSDTESDPETAEANAWQRRDLKFIAKQVASLLRHEEELSQTVPSQLSRRASVLRSCPASLPEEFVQLSQHREGRPLVVISVHPRQQPLATHLQSLLEQDGYEVWCSTELLKNDAMSDSQELFVSQESNQADGMGLGASLSQLSTQSFSDQASSVASHDKRVQFQQKADEAGVVIFILSSAFAQSKTSQQQVFYCEHRKRIIPVRFEDFCVPFWLSMLIGTGTMVDARSEGYEAVLKEQLGEHLSSSETNSEKVSEEKIAQEVTNLRKKLPKATYVYIAGSTMFFGKHSEEICNAIGKELAKEEDILVVTGGFYGVGETVGMSCAQDRDDHIWHVLPSRDDQDRSRQSRQNKDKTFAVVPYGKTIFSGSSVRERESIVARVCDICILVEGGPGAAHEAEEFTWNDHVVVPVICTGGAAGGKFGVPDKIYEVPTGVSSHHWEKLSDKTAPAHVVSEAVSRIIREIKTQLRMDSPTFVGTRQPTFRGGNVSPRLSVTFSPRKSPRRGKSLNRDKTFIYHK